MVYGFRDTEGAFVFWRDLTGTRVLNMRTDLRNHSPDGANWGYGGSGPAQLALALCCHVLPDNVALGMYQRFKINFVSRIKTDGWSISTDALRECVLAVFHEYKTKFVWDDTDEAILARIERGEE